MLVSVCDNIVMGCFGIIEEDVLVVVCVVCVDDFIVVLL